MRRVLVTGSRKLNEYRAVEEALFAQARIAGGLDKLIVIHGFNPRGADLFAHIFCVRHPEVTEEAYPADWNSFGKVAGMIRNGVMVAAGADAVLAFPRGESRGTYDCIARAKAAGLPVTFG